MASELNINKEMVYQILMQDLGKCKVSARFVLHRLLEEQKQLGLDMCDTNTAFLDSIVRGDESWCYQYDRES